MISQGWWFPRIPAVGLCLALVAPGVAGALELFPAAEVREAHALRQRILAEVPQVNPQQLREHPKLSAETAQQIQQRLSALPTREAENPFFHWAQGEIVRQTQGAAAAAPLFHRARQVAGPRFLVHWVLWQEYLARDLPEEARREEAALQAIQVAWGLARFPLLSTELMRSGDDAAEAGDFARATSLYDAALASTPESPQALLGRATYSWQTDKARALQVLRDLLRGISLAFHDPRTGYQLTGNLVLSLLATWLAALCVMAGILAIRTQPLFAHELNEGILKPFPPAAQFSLGLLCFLLPLALGLGVLWSAVFILLISAPYLTGRERIGVSAMLVLLVALPAGYQRVAARHVLASSRELALAAAVEEGGRGERLVQDLTRWSQDDPDNGLPFYYLGLTLKRRGEAAQAEAAATRAATLLPGAAFALVGLGNLQYLQGRLPEAETTYRMAAQLSRSAAAEMNLFRLYTQRLQFDLAKEALNRSTALDPHLAQTLSRFHGRGGTEFVVDGAVPWDTLTAGLPTRPGEVAEVAEGLWGAPLRGVGLSQAPYVAVLLVILFWLHATLWGRTAPVRRCHLCGALFCPRCQPSPREKEYCTPCATVFRPREGGVAAFVKVRRIREGEEWARQERARLGILGSILPGGSDLYRGRLLPGLGLALPAVWLLLEGLILDVATPTFRFDSPLPGALRWTVALLLLLGLYALSMQRSWRQAGTGAR